MVRAVTAGRVTAVVTQQLIDELAGVLGRPRPRGSVTLDDAAALVDALGREADLAPTAITPRAPIDRLGGP